MLKNLINNWPKGFWKIHTIEEGHNSNNKVQLKAENLPFNKYSTKLLDIINLWYIIIVTQFFSGDLYEPN